MQHFKQLMEKQEREKAEREAQAVKRRSGARSSGHTPSAGQLADKADPEKAEKKLLVSTFSFI